MTDDPFADGVVTRNEAAKLLGWPPRKVSDHLHLLPHYRNGKGPRGGKIFIGRRGLESFRERIPAEEAFEEIARVVARWAKGDLDDRAALLRVRDVVFYQGKTS